MKHQVIMIALFAAPAALAGGPAETEQFDLPSLPLSIFGVQFTADFLGPPVGTIIESRAELTFTTDASFDAADIIVSLQAPSEGVPVWEISGADLGWSGAGTFNAQLTSDRLDGVIDLGDPPPDFSLFFLAIHAEGFQPLGGQFSNSFFQVDVVPPTTPGDLDGDGSVSTADLLELLSQWGSCPKPPGECSADLDGSGAVGTGDLLILLANWG